MHHSSQEIWLSSHRYHGHDCHRNVASLASYASEPDASERATMSKALANYGSHGDKDKADETSAVVPVTDIENLPVPTTFDLS